MPTLCVTYDLHKPGQEYTELIAAIKRHRTWWHHLESTWFIVTNKTAASVREDLKQYLDKNDEILVFTVGSYWAGEGFKERAYAWLQKNWHSE